MQTLRPYNVKKLISEKNPFKRHLWGGMGRNECCMHCRRSIFCMHSIVLPTQLYNGGDVPLPKSIPTAPFRSLALRHISHLRRNSFHPFFRSFVYRRYISSKWAKRNDNVNINRSWKNQFLWFKLPRTFLTESYLITSL